MATKLRADQRAAGTELAVLVSKALPKAMTRLWAKREAQIQGVIEATVGMYGSLAKRSGD